MYEMGQKDGKINAGFDPDNRNIQYQEFQHFTMINLLQSSEKSDNLNTYVYANLTI